MEITCSGTHIKKWIYPKTVPAGWAHGIPNKQWPAFNLSTEPIRIHFHCIHQSTTNSRLIWGNPKYILSKGIHLFFHCSSPANMWSSSSFTFSNRSKSFGAGSKRRVWCFTRIHVGSLNYLTWVPVLFNVTSGVFPERKIRRRKQGSRSLCLSFFKPTNYPRKWLTEYNVNNGENLLFI